MALAEPTSASAALFLFLEYTSSSPLPGVTVFINRILNPFLSASLSKFRRFPLNPLSHGTLISSHQAHREGLPCVNHCAGVVWGAQAVKKLSLPSRNLQS